MSQAASLRVAVRASDGSEAATIELDPAVFGVEPNVAVMHQVVVAQLAAARAGTQSTLTRSEVRGGGAKPFRQKGTGRARQGSTRAAHWVGGAKALGPKPRSYRQKTPKKMVSLALRGALSDRAAQGRVVVVSGFDFEKPSTKAALALLGAAGVGPSATVVLSESDVVGAKSLRNIPWVRLVPRGELSAYDILRSDWVVFTEEALSSAAASEEVAK